MDDLYGVLKVEKGADKGEIDAAFARALSERRARRAKTSDLHVAYAILTDNGLRRSYDLARFGVQTGERIVEAKVTAVGFAQDVVAEIDLQDLARQMREVALKTVVLTSGATARAAELTAQVSRSVQGVASRQLTKSSRS